MDFSLAAFRLLEFYSLLDLCFIFLLIFLSHDAHVHQSFHLISLVYFSEV